MNYVSKSDAGYRDAHGWMGHDGITGGGEHNHGVHILCNTIGMGVWSNWIRRERDGLNGSRCTPYTPWGRRGCTVDDGPMAGQTHGTRV